MTEAQQPVKPQTLLDGKQMSPITVVNINYERAPAAADHNDAARDDEIDDSGDEQADLQVDPDKPRKIRRSRTTFTTYQLHQLERAFEKTQVRALRLKFFYLRSRCVSPVS